MVSDPQSPGARLRERVEAALTSYRTSNLNLQLDETTQHRLAVHISDALRASSEGAADRTLDDDRLVRELMAWADRAPNALGKADIRDRLLPAASQMLKRWAGASSASEGAPADELVAEMCALVRCEPEEVLETVQRLMWAAERADSAPTLRALGNCYMLAKRSIARILNGKPLTDDMSLERWQHVKRFCEEAGCISSILRAALPTENY